MIPTLAFMDEVLDLLTSTPTPQDIIAFEPSAELVQRSHELHERNRRGTLTESERGEFDELRRLNHLMNQLKNRAKLKLREQNTPTE